MSNTRILYMFQEEIKKKGKGKIKKRSREDSTKESSVSEST